MASSSFAAEEGEDVLKPWHHKYAMRVMQFAQKYKFRSLAKFIKVFYGFDDNSYVAFQSTPLFDFFSQSVAVKLAPFIDFRNFPSIGDKVQYDDSMIIYAISGEVQFKRPASWTRKDVVLNTYVKGEYFYSPRSGFGYMEVGAVEPVSWLCRTSQEKKIMDKNKGGKDAVRQRERERNRLVIDVHWVAKRKEDDEIERVRRDLELARKRIEKLDERKQKYLELREAAESRRRDFLRMTRPIEGKQNSLALERPNSAR